MKLEIKIGNRTIFRKAYCYNWQIVKDFAGIVIKYNFFKSIKDNEEINFRLYSTSDGKEFESKNEIEDSLIED